MKDIIKQKEKYFFAFFMVILLLSIIDISYLIYFRDLRDLKLYKQLEQKCQAYNFTQIIDQTSPYLLFDKNTIKKIFLLNYTNHSYYCEAKYKSCITSLYTCFDIYIFTPEINITI